MADLQTVELELEDETQEVELTIGDDSERYLELEFENEIDVIDTGGGGDEPSKNEIALIEGTLTRADYPTLTKVRDCCFYGQTALTEVNLPNVTELGVGAFAQCPLSELSFPKVTSIGEECFSGNTTITEIRQSENFPMLDELSAQAFMGMKALETVEFDDLSTVGSEIFKKCSKLKTLILRGSNFIYFEPAEDATPLFDGTLIGDGTGLIYIKDDLIDTYKPVADWHDYVDQIKPLSELPD